MTYVTPFHWPSWVELLVVDLTEVQITVVHKSLSHSWVGRRGEVATQDTLRIARLIKADLVQKQAVLDNITAQLLK